MNPAERSLELSRMLEGTSITLLSLTEGGETVTLRRDVVDVAPAVTLSARVVAAPCAGVFLRTHPLRSECLAEPGRHVAAGGVLGLLKIGPLLVEIRAPAAGSVSAVDATDGALVGFGTPLFRLSPEGDAP